jgi:hypothetical protein
MNWVNKVSEDMVFIIPDNLLIHLETWIGSAQGREVSGVGILRADPSSKTFTLSKCWLMAAGSVAYTEIPASRMVKIIKEGVRPDMIKVWWHRHPVGNGVPGPQNWSGTDNQTIREEPFGIDPSMVGWLVSIVRTPHGWVARYDDHKKQVTTHMAVQTAVSQEQYAAAASLIQRHIDDEVRAQMSRQESPRQRVSAPSRVRYPQPKSDNGSHIQKAYAMHGLKNQLKEIGWDRETYQEVRAALEFELPEFVAFDMAVTLAEMKVVALLTKTQMEETLRRIQIKVDQGDPQYLQLLENWDLVDL